MASAAKPNRTISVHGYVRPAMIINPVKIREHRLDYFLPSAFTPRLPLRADIGCLWWLLTRRRCRWILVNSQVFHLKNQRPGLNLADQFGHPHNIFRAPSAPIVIEDHKPRLFNLRIKQPTVGRNVSGKENCPLPRCRDGHLYIGLARIKQPTDGRIDNYQIVPRGVVINV